MTVRPRTEKRLLDAADELLFTRGLAATSVDTILERAGVSPATLYRAYGSKDGLVVAALARRHDAWMDVWDEAVAAAPDARARLLAVFDALETFRKRPDGARWCAFLGTSAEVADPPPELAAALQVDTDTMRQRLTELAVAVVGEPADRLVETLVLLVSGELAMRLRDGVAPGGARRAGVARAVAETVLQQWHESVGADRR